jgi:predicted nucleotidyltransferase
MDLLEVYRGDLDEIYKKDLVIAIIIFGSYLKSLKPLSDLDVCVITRSSLSDKQKEEILQFRDEMLDINIFEDLPLSLQFRVLHEGEIFKTKKDLRRLKNNIMNEWFDFRVILNRMYKKKGLLPIV